MKFANIIAALVATTLGVKLDQRKETPVLAETLLDMTPEENEILAEIYDEDEQELAEVGSDSEDECRTEDEDCEPDSDQSE